jgi:hypothetical protein
VGYGASVAGVKGGCEICCEIHEGAEFALQLCYGDDSDAFGGFCWDLTGTVPTELLCC